MSETFEKVTQGQPLEIAATTWNAVLEAAQHYRRQRLGQGGDAELTELVDPANVCLVTWVGATLPPFSILAPSDVLVSPVAHPHEVRRRPGFVGVAPSDTTAPFVVTFDPIASGAIGRAVAQGIVPCQVNVSDASHNRAIIHTGATDALDSAAELGVPIIWKESGTGLKWAVILLDFSGGGYATGGFHARLTASGTNASGTTGWKFVRLKLAAGAYADDGAEVAGFVAVAGAIDGTNLFNPFAGERVWMRPSKQSGYYEFLPEALKVREVDGAPAVLPVVTLEFNQDDGFEVADQGSGVARVGFTPATAFFAESGLPSPFNISSDATWLDTGVSITLPSAGDYLLFYVAQAVGQVSNFGAALGANVLTRLYDVDDAAVVGASSASALWIDKAFTTSVWEDTLTMPVLYTASGPNTLRLEAYRTPVTTWGSAAIGDTATGGTKIGYVKLA